MNSTKHWLWTMLEAMLPFDYHSLKELVNYTMDLSSPEAVIAHFNDLLGKSSSTDDFVHEFIKRRFGSAKESYFEEGMAREKQEKGYSKLKKDEIKLSFPKSSKKAWKNISSISKDLSNVSTCSLEIQAESLVDSSALNLSTKVFPHSQKKQSLGTLTSELGMKMQKSSHLKLNSLAEINSALKNLELKDMKFQGGKKCSCQARKHPLNQLIPNCLVCGKIICIVEGINSCSFCGTPLLLREQRMDLIKQLRMERTHILNNSKKETVAKNTKQFYSTCYRGSNSINLEEYEKKAQDAENDKNKLLELDRSDIFNKIIDEAADFDPYDRWISSSERYLMLEKQRKALAAMNTPKKRVMTIDSSGKVIMTSAKTDDEEENEENVEKEKSEFSSLSTKRTHPCCDRTYKPVFITTESTIVKNYPKELGYILKSGISKVQDDRDE
ncbi:hypothetical protein PNEG_00484 [Pneumocystis murina B123]|uniref:TRIP4/RQT4 C2HC5-type zinc finger domain-containing protein n=1 Tax=Pneumocystis murina (strain B123) TaxID=1069680 RepID=M7PLX6_PNEMU|nr:hypothetical protein PNEG_00484 [Pneumocystis murina B123]EMR11469.1 hypothetical protein PNEG_00484 [Pneumocystis murina B123]